MAAEPDVYITNCTVNPLDSFDTAVGHHKPPPTNDTSGAWVVRKRLAGHRDKLTWERAVEVIHDPACATEHELGAMQAIFSEGSWLDWYAVQRQAGATPYELARLFHACHVTYFMAVAWLDQYSDRPSKAQLAAELHVAERYWIEDGKCVVADGYDTNTWRRTSPRSCRGSADPS